MSLRRAFLVAIALLSHGTGCGDTGDVPDAGFSPDAMRLVDADTGAIFHESFGPDIGTGPAWPTGWVPLGGVATSTLEGGRGNLVPVVSDYSLARMAHVLPAGARDVDVVVRASLLDHTRQGFGVYVRQNGGYLRQTALHGSGYAVFIEGFRGDSIGLWRERDGVEEELVRVPVFDLSFGFDVRFRCVQTGGVTTLSARIWRGDLELEPDRWDVTITDDTPALQNFDGALAVDAWNTTTPAAGPPPDRLLIDDLEVVPL